MSETNGIQPSSTELTLGMQFRLWLGTLGGAVMWLLHLISAYLLAEFGCVSRWGELSWRGINGIAWLGLATSTLMLIGSLVALQVARRNRRRWNAQSLSEATGFHGGERFMAESGIVSNLVFILIIAVQTIPFFFYLKGC